jgi:uncharacterized protein
VILDATWREERTREAARRMAEATCADMIEMRCVAPRALLRRRLTGRRIGVAMSSDATLEVLDRMEFQPWRSATDVDTSARLSKSLAAAVAPAAPGRRSRSRTPS